MLIKTLEVAGIGPAIHAMRNPMDSWSKSDTHKGHIGDKDKALATGLIRAGTEHCKHLRMCIVWAEIWAPRYWWTEFDTYRAGVEKLSCSTMHKITSRTLTPDDFEIDYFTDELAAQLNYCNALISSIQELRHTDQKDQSRALFRALVQALPQSLIQRRTVMMSYQALRSIYHQREGHKLREWEAFRAWCESLPESWMITIDNDDKPII